MVRRLLYEAANTSLTRSKLRFAFKARSAYRPFGLPPGNGCSNPESYVAFQSFKRDLRERKTNRGAIRTELEHARPDQTNRYALAGPKASPNSLDHFSLSRMTSQAPVQGKLLAGNVCSNRAFLAAIRPHRKF